MAGPFDSPLRGGLGSPFDAPLPEERQTTQPLPEDASFARGLRTGTAGVTLGSLAEDALDAEKQGDVHRLSALRQQSARLRGEMASNAPRVTDLSQINNIGDAWDFAAGTAGSMLPQAIPVVAAGALASFAPEFGIPALGATLETGASSYALYRQLKQSTLAAQEQDPTAMARGPEAREAEAQKSAALGTAAGAIPLGRNLAGLAPTRMLPRMALGAGEGAVAGHVMTAAEQESLKNLDPDLQLDTGSDRTNTAIGAFLGALGGIHGPPKEAPSAKGAPSKEPAVPEPVEPAAKVDRMMAAGQKVGETARNFKDWMGSVFGGGPEDEARKVDDLVKGDANADLQGATSDQTVQNLERADGVRKADAKDFAEKLLNDPDTSPEVKKTIQDFGGNFDKPDAQQYIGRAMQIYSAGERAGRAMQWLTKTVGALVKSAPEESENVKKNRQDPASYIRSEDIVMDGLKPELQSNPAALRQVKGLARLLTDLTVRGNDISNSALRAFGGYSNLELLFDDPAAVLDSLAKSAGVDSLSGRIRVFSTAQEDAKAQGGRLYQALPPDRRESITTGQLRQLAQFIDHVAQGGSVKGDAVELLTRVYGSKEVAQHVLDYYERRAKHDEVYEKQPAQEGEPASPTEAAMTEKEAPSEWGFQTTASGGQRGFHASELPLAQQHAEALRGQRPGSATRMATMAEYAKREGRSAMEVLAEVRRDLKERMEGHTKRLADEPQRQEQIDRLRAQYQDTMDQVRQKLASPIVQAMPEAERNEFAAQFALSRWRVPEIIGEKSELVADDKFIKEAKTGLRAKQESRDSRENVTFTTADGKNLTLHAPSMVRAMGVRQGAGAGESSATRASRLFKDAVSSVLGREDVTGLAHELGHVRLTKNRTLDELDFSGFTKREQADEAKFDKMRELAAESPEQLARVQEHVDEQENKLRNEMRPISDNVARVVDNLDRQTKHQPYNAEFLESLGQRPRDWLASAAQELSHYRGLLDSIDELRQDLYQQAREFEGGVTSTEEIGKTEGPRSVIEGQEPLRREQPRGETAQGVGPEPRVPERIDPKLGATLMTPEEIERAKSELGWKPSVAEDVGPKTDEAARELNKQDPSGARMTPDEAQKIKDDIAKWRGPDVKAIVDKFHKDIGGSGEWSIDPKTGERVIKVAVDAVNPYSVAFHESMHDFIGSLMGSDRRIQAALQEAADAGPVRAQMEKLLGRHADELKDPAERVAYMAQFWAEGQLRLGTAAHGIFERVFKFIRDVLGVVSRHEQAEKILRALHDGKFADPNTVMAQFQDLRAETLGDKAARLSGPIGDVVGKFAKSSIDRLLATSVPALSQLADMFHMAAGRETGKLGFLQERQRQENQLLNKYFGITQGMSNVEMREALERFQKMQKPVTPKEQALRAFLNEMETYMREAGVKTFDERGREQEFGHVENYFPRVFDRRGVLNAEASFRAAFGKHMAPGAVDDLFRAVTSGNGALELAESEHDLGFTPWNRSIKDRKLTFINEQNAHEFAPFQLKNMHDIMTTYIKQATHRAEYARTFGNRGERIQELMAQAKIQGATPEQLETAGKAVQALEGTLGYDMNPRLRAFNTGMAQYQNLILLNLSLFSSLIDPQGIMLRTGESSDAFAAYKRGFGDLVKSFRGRYKDGDYELARTMGIISDGSQADALGSAYDAQYGARWLKTVNDAMFRYNGMERWNQSMRIAAMRAGMRFLVRNTKNAGEHSERYMKELGVQAGDIKEMPDGKIATSVADGLTAEQEKRVQSALYSFVDSAIVRPNAAHRPIWGSDPHWALVFHLKQFTYSMQNVILKRVRHELQNGNRQVAVALASYVPMMIAADLAKAVTTGTIHTNWGLMDYMGHGVQRAGVLGVGSFAADAWADAAMGNVPGASLAGPAAGQLLTAGQALAGHKTIGDLLIRSSPMAGILRMTPMAD